VGERPGDIALARHEEIVTAAVVGHEGVVLRARGEGDSTFSVFSRATDALAAAYAAQVGLGAERWPAGARLAVRFAVHSGESVERNRDYLGPAVNRAARLRAVGLARDLLCRPGCRNRRHASGARHDRGATLRRFRGPRSRHRSQQHAAWNTWRDRHLDRLRTDLSAIEFSTGWSAGQRLEPGVLVKEALIEARRSVTPDGASAV
jgi:class 3 adenylate cyclase